MNNTLADEKILDIEGNEGFKSSVLSSRMFKGKKTGYGEGQWVMTISAAYGKRQRFHHWKLECPATFLNYNWIITEAHCVH
jgi:hypothetical protein